jgi:hypothetical protein
MACRLPRKRALTLLTGAGLLICAAPALADSSVGVTIIGLGGTRQFAVEDAQGQTLSAINLGTGGSQPFRLHVTDSAFLPAATGGNYSVSATMSNLYLKTGSGSTSTDYNYNVKVPSSAVSISYGASPLSVSGLALTLLPKLNISGTMSSCLNLSGTLKTLLGVNALGGVIGSNSALSSLCTTLGVAGSALSAQVDGAMQTLYPTLTDLTKLPTALAGTTGGAFTQPSFASGVGAYDTAGAAAAGSTQPTSVALMTGTTGAALSSALITDLTTQLTAALTGPLTSASGSGTQTTLASVISVLQASGTTVLNQLGAVINQLSASDQATLINALFTTSSPVAPVLSTVQGITGSSYAFPVLKATPTTPVAGTYGGTLTVTFVQS